jgi:hypothetical protein
MKKSNKIIYFSLLAIAFVLVASLFSHVFDFTLLSSAIGSAPVAYAITPFISLDHDEAACNMAGISTVIYVIRVDDIESFPTLAGTTADGLVTYDGDFVLKSNKYWDTYYSTQQMGELKSEVAGPRDGEFFNITASFFYPNTSKEAIGMANQFKNADVIVIVKEFSGSGQMRVVGSMELPARIKPSENSGKAFADQKGITFNIEAFSCSPAKVYEGSIVTETEVVYAPVRMSVDAVAIDVFTGKRFVVGANTGAKTLSTITNMVPGDRVHISFDGSSANSLAFTGAYGATATINADGEYFVIEKNANNEYVIIDGSFA